MTATLDLTDIDIAVSANTTGGIGTLTLVDSAGAAIPLQVAASPYPGEILADRSAADGSGTATTNPVVGDGTAGQFQLTIPSDLEVGQHFVTVTVTADDGATYTVSGPLTVQHR